MARWPNALFILGVAASSGLRATAAEARAAAPTERGEDKERLTLLVEGANGFGLDLYQKLAADEGDLFFSPFSIHTALWMTQVGARGSTAKALAKTLHLGSGESDAALARDLLAALKPAPNRRGEPAFELEVANALWPAKSYPFLEPFTRVLKESFAADARALDFGGSPPLACDAINSWAKEKTRGRISEIVNPDVVNGMTRLILTNAIYFKSAWQEDFSKSATRNEPFFVTAQTTETVPLMHQTAHFQCWESPSLQGVLLPYQRGELSMVLLVPRKRDGLSALEKSLSLKSLNAGIQSARRRVVQLSLPRFRTESSFSLQKTLSALGAGEIFSSEASFSGMSDREKLFVSAVLHKSFIAVDEEGTEAAAVTAVAVTKAAKQSDPEEPVVVRADRPFMFAIRHNATGAILFLGRLVKPAKA